MAHPDLPSELALIERALRPEQFRFLVVQYNHMQALTRLQERLRAAFPSRTWTEMDGQQDGPQAILTLLQHPPAGLLFIHHAEALLDKEGFTRSLNQRRDALSRRPLGLILLLPTGGDYLHRLARAMPDLWSLRNLVAELFLPPAPGLDSPFITLEGQQYFSFSSQAEAQAELDSLHTRIAELESLPGNRPLLALLLIRQGKIQLQRSEYAAAEASFRRALALAREARDPALEATTLTELGEVLTQRGEYEAARGYLEESLRMVREVGDKAGEGAVLNHLSQIFQVRGDYETALGYLEQSLRISREIGDKVGEGRSLNYLGNIAQLQRQYEKAKEYLEKSLDVRQKLGDKTGEGITLNNLSQIYAVQGDPDTAQSLLERSLHIQREIGDITGQGATLNNLANMAYARGDYEVALAHLRQSLRIQRPTGSIHGLAITLSNIAVILFKHQHQPEEALPLFWEAYQVLEQLGSPQAEVPRRYLEDIEKQVGPTRYQQLLDALTAPPPDLP